VFFSEADDGRYTPRALLFDLEPRRAIPQLCCSDPLISRCSVAHDSCSAQCHATQMLGVVSSHKDEPSFVAAACRKALQPQRRSPAVTMTAAGRQPQPDADGPGALRCAAGRWTGCRPSMQLKLGAC
jgi:hypothetical protein